MWCICSGSNCGFNLMTNDVKHIFVCLFVSCIYSSVEYLFMFFYLFPIWIIWFFLMLRFKSTSYILGNSSLLSMWFENIFFQVCTLYFYPPNSYSTIPIFSQRSFYHIFFSATIDMIIWFSSLAFHILNYTDYCWILGFIPGIKPLW